jgi:hypothetical protein
MVNLDYCISWILCKHHSGGRVGCSSQHVRPNHNTLLYFMVALYKTICVFYKPAEGTMVVTVTKWQNPHHHHNCYMSFTVIITVTILRLIKIIIKIRFNINDHVKHLIWWKQIHYFSGVFILYTVINLQ